MFYWVKYFDLFVQYCERKLDKYNLKGVNKPKRTPNHPTKSHVVLAKDGDKTKLIRFGQQGVKGAGDKPKTEKQKARQKSFKARSKAPDQGTLREAYHELVKKEQQIQSSSPPKSLMVFEVEGTKVTRQR